MIQPCSAAKLSTPTFAFLVGKRPRISQQPAAFLGGYRARKIISLQRIAIHGDKLAHLTCSLRAFSYDMQREGMRDLDDCGRNRLIPRVGPQALHE